MHHLLRREHADGLSLCEPREQQGTSCSCASMPSHPLHTSSLSHTHTPPPPPPIGLQQEVAEGDKHVAMQQRVTASTKKRRTRERPALAKLLVVTTRCVREGASAAAGEGEAGPRETSRPMVSLATFLRHDTCAAAYLRPWHASPRFSLNPSVSLARVHGGM